MPGTDWIDSAQTGDVTSFADQYMKIAPVFEVGGDRYRWLRESLFLEKAGRPAPGQSNTTSTGSSSRSL